MPDTRIPVSFRNGLRANLPATKTAGQLLLTTDERAMYFDVDSNTRIRLGDFQSFANLAALEANTHPSATALYYVEDLNVLAKWDATNSRYVKINLDTGATGVETSGAGNAITGATYNAATRVITFSKGGTFALASYIGDIPAGASATTVVGYIQEAANAVKGDTTDTSSDITVRGARALANEKVASVTATANHGITVDNTDAQNPTVGVKLSSKAGNQLSFATGSGEDGGLYLSVAAASEYTIVEAATAETGYLKTYNLQRDGVNIGASINIPKDFLMKSAEIKTVTTADEPYAGAQVGDVYIDFIINVKSGTATNEHIYLPVNDLVDAYQAGNGIELGANNTFSVKLDSTGAAGLTVGASGLKLANATPDTYTGDTKTADGAAGAMSGADKYKLNGIADGATKVEASTTPGDGNIKINGTNTKVYELPNTVAMKGDAQSDTSSDKTIEGTRRYAEECANNATVNWGTF